MGAELSNRDTHTAGLMTERLLLLASHPSVRPPRPPRPPRSPTCPLVERVRLLAQY